MRAIRLLDERHDIIELCYGRKRNAHIAVSPCAESGDILRDAVRVIELVELHVDCELQAAPLRYNLYEVRVCLERDVLPHDPHSNVRAKLQATLTELVE